MGQRGTLSIAPEVMTLLEDAVHLMIDLNSSKAIFSPDKSLIPLASLPNGMPLVLGPDITAP